jgi:hypothetical protein
MPTAVDLPHVVTARKKHPHQVSQPESESARAEQINSYMAERTV